MPFLQFLNIDKEDIADLLGDDPMAIVNLVAQSANRYPEAWKLIQNLIYGIVPIGKPKSEETSSEGW